jgi:S-DNA-T family DNA segregation ATPase FtsK/SpoIIIE
MATRRKAATPTQDMTAIIVAVGFAGMIAAIWFGLPGVFVLWAAVVFASWSNVAVNPDDEKSVRRHSYAKQLQTSLIFPFRSITNINQSSWITGILFGLLGFLIPCTGDKAISSIDGHWINAILAAFLSFAITGARASVLGSDFPGLPLTKIKGAAKSVPFFVLGAVLGFGLGILGAYELGTNGSKLGYPIQTTLLKPAAGLNAAVYAHKPSGITLISPILFIITMALLVGWLIFVAAWGKESLVAWKELSESRVMWGNYWLPLKKDPPPRLIERVVIEDILTVETFQILPHENVSEYLAFESKFVAMTGAARVATLSVPERDDQPGTWSPTKFAIAQWADTPDVTSASAEVTSWWLRSCMAWTVHTASVYPEPVLARLSLISEGEDVAADIVHSGPSKSWWTRFKENSPKTSTLEIELKKEEIEDAPPASGPGDQLWCSNWNFPPNCASWYMREEMLDTLIGFSQTDVAIDHRSDTVYFGVLEGDSVNAKHAAIIDSLATQDRWRNIWKNALKSGVNAPRAQSPLALTAELTSGAEINRMPFSVSEGIDPQKYRDVEGNLKTALGGAKFVAVTGWPDVDGGVGRPGDRHPQALCVYWSMDYVPMTPSKLEPSISPANQWVLAGVVNEVFKTLKLPLPEVTSVRALTSKKATEHTWAISLRLYGDVTTANIRKNNTRIAEMLAIPWVRVTDAEDGCILYLGAIPTDEMVAKESDRALVASLNWEQAFLLTSVVGTNGSVPTLVSTGHLPSNELVQVLDFALPPGLNQSIVKSSIQKLRTATGNAYIEVQSSDNGPTHITVQTSVENPLSFPIPVDFEAADRAQGLAFATGVSGEPVEFVPATDVHVAIIGMTGSGKSVTAQVILYGAAIKGYDIYVIDPQKGAADFKFIEPYAKAIATTVGDAALTLRAIYAEVERRKDLNSKYGAASINDLPDEVRPPPIFVFIDEFTSLIISTEKIDRSPLDDPVLEAERQEQIAEKNDRATVGMMTGRLARESRSAGVALGLGTQKLMANTLDSIPGGGDLKTNMSRLLIGNTSMGERMSALRAFDQAPDPGENIPKGRAIWESAVRTGILIQGWYAPASELAEELAKRITPLPEDEKIDIVALRKRKAPAATAFSPVDGGEVVKTDDDEVTDIGEFAFSLDDVEEETPAVTEVIAEEVSPPEPIIEEVASGVAEAASDDVWSVFADHTPESTDSDDDEFGGWSRPVKEATWEG